MIQIRVKDEMFAYDMYHICKAFCPEQHIEQVVSKSEDSPMQICIQMGEDTCIVEEKEINVIEAVPGDIYVVGEMTLTILAPLGDEYENTNNYSIVTRVDVGETSALFTGDAEREVENALLGRYTTELDCDLYQAGHHGSSTSNSTDFIAAAAPSAVVISCGKDNSYGHPHRETLEIFEGYGVEVFRTDLMGDIIFVSDGEKIFLHE
jgi:competence protein ComEC